MKKLICVLLIVSMVFSLTAVAFASEVYPMHAEASKLNNVFESLAVLIAAKFYVAFVAIPMNLLFPGSGVNLGERIKNCFDEIAAIKGNYDDLFGAIKELFIS